MGKKYEGKPIIIGIAGGSGSGKSTFAKALADKLQPLKVENISTDHFFKMPLPTMISPSTGREVEDWNSPKSIDSDKFIETVRAFREGDSDVDVVLVEGLSVLYFEELLDFYDLKLFVELDTEERMYRRIQRNMKAWGVTMEEVADYFLEAAKFSEQRNFLWTKRRADLFINGGADFEMPVNIVSLWIQNKLNGER